MEHKFSINEISERLNLSRNTVSKVLRGKPGVSPKTQKLILDFVNSGASELNEPQPAPDPAAGQNRTVLFSYRHENIEYINDLLAGIEKALKDNGYSLTLNIVHDTPSRIPLPPYVFNGGVAGIISFNIYDGAYWREVISLGIPSVFIDTFAKKYLFAGTTDIIAPESECAIHAAVSVLANSGRKNFGYFGNPDYCYSLQMRWQTFKYTLDELGLPFVYENCILDISDDPITDLEKIQRLGQRLRAMKSMPDAFICGSDRQAVLLLKVLGELSLSVPDNVAVLGFDNLPESLRQSPPLSTIDAHSRMQGELAVKKILERIQDPSKIHEFIQCETTLILRGSTGHSS